MLERHICECYKEVGEAYLWSLVHCYIPCMVDTQGFYILFLELEEP